MSHHPVDSWSRVSTLDSTFWTICEDSYSKYLYQCNDIEQIDNEEESYELSKEASKNAFSTIIFSAMCVEASIYNYAAIQLGDNYVQSHLDRMDLLSKWVVVPKLICGKEINKGGVAYAHLKGLVKARNDLVHHKSLPIKNMDEALFQKLEKEEENFTKNVHSAYRALIYLSLEMTELVGHQYNPLRSLDKKVAPFLLIPDNLIDVVAECKSTFSRSKGKNV